MARYNSRDPFWLTSRFAGKCAKCGAQIRKGDRVFYYPSTRSIFCEKRDECGPAHSREFDASRSDEAFLGGSYLIAEVQ
jgi:hypothetical protein